MARKGKNDYTVNIGFEVDDANLKSKMKQAQKTVDPDLLEFSKLQQKQFSDPKYVAQQKAVAHSLTKKGIREEAAELEKARIARAKAFNEEKQGIRDVSAERTKAHKRAKSEIHDEISANAEFYGKNKRFPTSADRVKTGGAAEWKPVPVFVGGVPVAEHNAKVQAEKLEAGLTRAERKAQALKDSMKGLDMGKVAKQASDYHVELADSVKEIERMGAIRQKYIDKYGDKAGAQMFMQKLRGSGIQGDAVPTLDQLEAGLNDVATAQTKTGVAAEKTTKSYAQQRSEINRVAADARRMAEVSIRASTRIDQVARTAQIAGLALTGGIFAEANRYAQTAKTQTDATRGMTVATNELASARRRVDEVLARETLPIMQQVAVYANKAAGIIEKNPQLVGMALKAGGILVAVGALGGVIAKGLRLYADAKYFSATIAQFNAINANTAALNANTVSNGGEGVLGLTGKLTTLIQSMRGYGKTGGLIGPAQAGASGLAARAGLLTAAGGSTALGALLAGALGIPVGVKLYDLLIGGKNGYSKSGDFGVVGAYKGGTAFGKATQKLTGDSDAEIERKSIIFAAIIGKLTHAIDENHPLWIKAANSVKKASDIMDTAMGKLANSENAADIAKAFTDWKKDDTAMVRKAVEDRKKIIADSETDLTNSTKQYQQRIRQISAAAGSAGAQLRSQFDKANKQAETDYAKSRSEIVQAGADDIKKIEEKHRADLEKLAKDHNNNMNDLLAARDALGMAKEQDRYAEAVAEANKGKKEEITQRKRETSERLQELATAYAAEKAQRAQQYLEDRKENSKQYGQQMAEAQAAYADEQKQIRAQRVEKLKELQDSLVAERTQRRNQFLDQFAEMSKAYTGERQIRGNYYAIMLQDAEAFMSAYRARMSAGTATVTGTRATGGAAGSTATNSTASSTWDALAATWKNLFGHESGGYAYKPQVSKLAEKGKEFVMNNATTLAAERLIGAQLSQESLLQALSAQRGAQVNYNDQRRFNSGISAGDRRAIARDTQDLLEGLIRS